ncbi:MAG: HNH endonuclease [Bacteroidetes bacterium]|nr:HNH endonuclease [Bacteroidota bacterium]
MAVRKPIRFLKNEKWKDIPGHESKGSVWYKYAISNQGRIVKYNLKIEDGFLLRLSREGGYPIWRKRLKGKYFAALLHRLVAKYFLPKPGTNQKFIIHLDHDKENNRVSNLKWATQEQVSKHNKNNPRVKAFLRDRKLNHNVTWSKLSETKVVRIKQMLQQGKTLKEIAGKFGVSDMQVHRIKTGENWSHITVPKK